MPMPDGTPTPEEAKAAQDAAAATKATEDAAAAAKAKADAEAKDLEGLRAAAEDAKRWKATFGDNTPEQVLAYLQAQDAKLRAGAAAPPAKDAPKPKDIRDLILDDPEQVLDWYFKARLGPIIQELYDHSTAMTREVVTSKQAVVKDKDGKETVRPAMPHYGRFKKEIEDFVSKVDVRLRNKPETWTSAYNFVVGSHLDELVQEEAAKRLPAVEPGGAGAAAVGAGGPKLTDEETAVARGLGLTPEEYVKWKE